MSIVRGVPTRRPRTAASLAAMFALAASPVATPALAQAPAPSLAAPEIVVTGTSTVRVRPDRAVLQVSVESRALTAAAAGSENARRLRAVLDSLRGVGHAAGSLSTIGYSIQPEWRHGTGRAPQLVGYVARNGVQVEIRDLDRLGRTIDAALAGGANLVAGLQFTTDSTPALQLVALDSAVQHARRRAEVMARAAGGTLGTLRLLTTERTEPHPMVGGAVSLQAARVVTPIEEGELAIRVTVEGRWTFVPTAGGRP